MDIHDVLEDDLVEGVENTKSFGRKRSTAVSKLRSRIAVVVALLFMAMTCQSVLMGNAGDQDGEKYLSVPYFHQGSTMWCFYTSLAMTMQYYGKTVHPWDVAEHWKAGHDEGYYPGLGVFADIFDADDVSAYLKIYGLDTDWLAGGSARNFDTYVSHIGNNEPLIVGGRGHAIVIVGYKTEASSNYLYVHDPLGNFVHDEWDLVDFSTSYMYVEVPWDVFVNFYWPIGGVIGPGVTIMSIYGTSPNPPEGTVYLTDGGLIHTSTSDNHGRLYLGNQFAWQDIDAFEANGQEILLDESVAVFLKVSNQFSASKSYRVSVELKTESGVGVYADNELTTVQARSVEEVHFDIDLSTISNLKAGPHRFYLAIYPSNPGGSPYDMIGPINVVTASNFGRNPTVSIFDDKLVVPADGIPGFPWDNVDIKATFNAYVHILESQWYWTFCADPTMQHSGKSYRDTGKTALEFQLNVYDDKGNHMQTQWISTDTDDDDIYGDYSHKGGATKCVEWSKLPLDDKPQKLRFTTKWRLYDEFWWPLDVWIETNEIESTEVLVTPIAIPEGYYFIQLTDTHVNEIIPGTDPWGKGTKERFNSVTQRINSLHPAPAFLLITGDLVDWGGDPWGEDSYNAFNNILSNLNPDVEVYVAPGNHDWFPTPPLPGGLENYHDMVESRDDYSLDGGDYRLISMNSGHSTPLPTDPDSSGLENSQIEWLEDSLDMLDGVKDGKDASTKLKFVFMHHPYAFLTKNAESFVTLADNYEVAMVMAGHTHENNNVDKKRAYYPSNTWNKNIGPMFVETQHAVDYGYRTVNIKGSVVKTSANVFKPTIRISLYSPADLHVYDSLYVPQGNHVGYDLSGNIEVDIDDSYFLRGDGIRPQTASVPYGEDYRIEVIGKDHGSFNLKIEYLLENVEDPMTVLYRNVDISPGMTAIVYLDHPTPDYTMYINGRTVPPDEIVNAVISEPLPPIADVGPDLVGNEGETIQLDGTYSQPRDGEIIEYKWTFNGHTLYGPNPTFVWYDNCVVTVTLTITYRITYTEIDDDDNVVTKTRIETASDTLTVTILNVNPTSSINRAYMYVDFTFRMAGEKWHNANLTLYEYEKVAEGLFENVIEKFHSEVERYPGDPDEQSVTVYDVYIDMEKRYCTEATFNPYEDDNPISGQLWGSNPIWIDLTFEDGSTERIHHNFNVQQSLVRDSEHWVHIEPWCVDLSPWFVGHWVTFEATATDVGTDDLTLVWDFGDGSNQTNTSFHTFRPPEPYKDLNSNGIWDSGEPFDDINSNSIWDNGPDDPYPSPYDEWGGSYPPIVNVKVWHVYTFEDDFIVTLTVTDDDNHTQGIGEDTLDIEAIHTDHDCSTR